MALHDYLPGSYAKLLTWLTNFIAYLNKADVRTRLGLSADLVDSLKTLIDVFVAACKAADAANAGSVDRLNRQEQAKSITKTIRHFVNINLRYNEAVTDEDRKQLGLTIPDAKPTTDNDPAEYPEIEADTSILRQIKCRFLNREHRTAKPRRVHGIEVLHGFVPAGEKPSLKHLTHSTFSTRAIKKLDFTDEERGMRLGLCARYENNTGGKGPFGPIVIVFVP
ncbi:MAG: hypothetical protein LBL07_18320 [Tannerella sp.]|jgi:hypothetical protein|nr:hypothetical protein [Tannerella sp.]